MSMSMKSAAKAWREPSQAGVQHKDEDEVHDAKPSGGNLRYSSPRKLLKWPKIRKLPSAKKSIIYND